MPQPQMAPAGCAERQEIADSLQAITEQIVALLLAEVDAALKADIETLERMEQDLQKAMNFQQSIRERYISHTQSHGCLAPSIH